MFKFLKKHLFWKSKDDEVSGPKDKCFPKKFCRKLTFGAGIYTGIYISQTYEIPRVDEPGKIVDKIKEFADEHRKKNPVEQLLYDVKKEAKKIIE